MFLTELIIKVFKLKKRDIAFFLTNTLVLILFYWLLFEDSEIIYPSILSSFIFVVYIICEIIKYKGFSEKLVDVKKSPNYKKNSVDYKEEEVTNCYK